MNIKTQAILSVIPLIVGFTAPVMAQTASETAATQAPVNSVSLKEKAQNRGLKGGMCGKGRFEGGPAGFKAERGQGNRRFHRSLFSGLRGEAALTDAQLEQMAKIKNEFRQEEQPKIADLFSTERKLRDQLFQPNADKAQLASLQSQINADKDAISNLKLSAKLEEMNLLTAPQKQELRHDFLKRSVEFDKG